MNDLQWLDTAMLETAVMMAEEAAGMIPPGASRPTFPHERFVDFAGIDDIMADGYRETAAALHELRSSILDAMTNAIGGAEDPDKLARAVRDFGATQSRAVREAIDETTTQIAESLASVNHRAAAGLLAEARRQHVVADRVLPAVTADRYQPVAGIGPNIMWQRMNAAAAAAVSPVAVPPTVIKAAEKTPTAQAEDSARQGVHVAHGDGREQMAKNLPEPKRVYASELLDGNTCDRCAQVDGREYDSLDTALLDYPDAGPYRLCRGEARCRGTLVMVWDDPDPDDTIPAPLGPKDLPDAGQAVGQGQLHYPNQPGPDGWNGDPRELTDVHLTNTLEDVIRRVSVADAEIAELETMMDRLIGEIDWRETRERAAEEARQAKALRAQARREAAAERRQVAEEAASARINQLLDAGFSEVDAIADAYNVSTEVVRRRQTIERLRADGHTGRGLEQLARSSYRAEIDRVMLEAETVTHGFLLNAEATRINTEYLRTGRGRYIDSDLLFTGNAAFAARWASQELRDYWAAAGRLTYEAWKMVLTSGRPPGLMEGWS
ncbi:hypothetical protein D1871_11055 [Nakamurella silvestris]|nr:hypothetical protein D1871_11055 [Nakamurella silvestris]